VAAASKSCKGTVASVDIELASLTGAAARAESVTVERNENKKPQTSAVPAPLCPVQPLAAMTLGGTLIGGGFGIWTVIYANWIRKMPIFYRASAVPMQCLTSCADDPALRFA
jgi:hypothetical protein